MTQSYLPISIQLWAPGLDVSQLVVGLHSASVLVVEKAPELDDPSDLPLLVVYTDPLGLCQQSKIELAVDLMPRLLAWLSESQGFPRPLRVVNAACLNIPAIVAWCVDPYASLCEPPAYFFVEPDPLNALLAIELLSRIPRLSSCYLALERHPLAALLDQRPVDSVFEQRYRESCGWNALLQARMNAKALDNEITALAKYIEPLGECQLASLVLHEQLQLATARLAYCHQFELRCSELELSLQACQHDLEVLTRRLSLLESLVSTASETSTVAQRLLAQAAAS